MSNQFRWEITQLEVQNTKFELENVVVAAHWKVSISDSENETSFFGTSGIPFLGENDFTPYADLTNDVVIGWVKELLGKDEKLKIEAELLDALSNLKAPAVSVVPLPWAN